MNFSEMQDRLNRFKSYHEQDKTNVELILTISYYSLKLGDWAAAQNYLDEAKKLKGSFFWPKQGMIYLETQQLDSAEAAFIEALREEYSPENIYNLAFCYFLNKAFENALSLLKDIEEHQLPNDVAFMKAKILLHLMHSNEAIRLLEKLHNKNPSDGEVAGLLSLLYFDSGSIELAQSLSQQALAINPLQHEGQLVEFLLKTLKNKAPAAEIKAFLSAFPDEARLHYALGTVMMQDMDIVSALEAFTKTTEIWPYFYEAWINLGWCFLYQDNIESAEKMFQQAVRIHEEKADAWGGFALIAILQNNINQATTCLEKAFSLDSDCYLACIAQIIIANQNPIERGTRQFNKLFPEAIAEVERIMHSTQVVKPILH